MANMKLVYKHTLAMDLIRMGHDLEYTARNRANKKYQVYFFPWSEKLERDLAWLNGQKYVGDLHNE